MAERGIILIWSFLIMVFLGITIYKLAKIVDTKNSALQENDKTIKSLQIEHDFMRALYCKCIYVANKDTSVHYQQAFSKAICN